MTFADRLLNARLTANLTQTEAARQIGKTQSEWSAIERGVYCPDVAYRRLYGRLTAAHARITAIAVAVGLTFNDLVPPESLPEWPVAPAAPELSSDAICTDSGCLGCNAADKRARKLYAPLLESKEESDEAYCLRNLPEVVE